MAFLGVLRRRPIHPYEVTRFMRRRPGSRKLELSPGSISAPPSSPVSARAVFGTFLITALCAAALFIAPARTARRSPSPAGAGTPLGAEAGM